MPKLNLWLTKLARGGLSRDYQVVEHPSGRAHRRIPHLRWWIGFLLFASTIINYIDRQTLSVSAPYLKAEKHWTNTDFAGIIIAFRISYSFLQFLGGRMVDLLGTRRGLTITVAWYSLVGMLTSRAGGLWSFRALRFGLGIGEAANWPGAIKAVAEWFPARERGLGACPRNPRDK
jgi:ACS family hexuronate transporter-like MFS transporter